MRGILGQYYNKRETPYGMSGDRKGKTLPLLKGYTGKRVLDVGCAKGYVGEQLKKQGNTVIGWDIDERAVKEAKKTLDNAYLVDLESDKWPEFKEKFDLIVILEVIEHLFEPDEVLLRLCKLLKPGGKILISTPNLLHVYHRIPILMGKFDYHEDKVINPGHIHFFTHSSLMRMLREIKFTVEKENNVIFPRTLASIWQSFPNLFAYQMVVLCQPKKK